MLPTLAPFLLPRESQGGWSTAWQGSEGLVLIRREGGNAAAAGTTSSPLSDDCEPGPPVLLRSQPGRPRWVFETPAANSVLRDVSQVSTGHVNAGVQP